VSNNNPNREEQLVLDCLVNQGYTDLKYEPDGNIPPDILLNGSIAIEVRRLNQNIPKDDGFEGLEQLEYSVHGLLRSIMDKFPSEPEIQSAFVGYHFKRPLPPLDELKKKIQEILINHKSIIHKRKKYLIGDNFELELLPASNKLDRLYKYGMSSDMDSGGFVISLIYENLNLIITEKEGKVSKYKKKYPEWWLGLVDNVGYVMGESDLKQFDQLPKLNSLFTRILMVSPLDSSHFIYLYE
jgi:hypothetical protein